MDGFGFGVGVSKICDDWFVGEKRNERCPSATVVVPVIAMVNDDGQWRDECFHTVEIPVQVTRVQRSQQ